MGVSATLLGLQGRLFFGAPRAYRFVLTHLHLHQHQHDEQYLVHHYPTVKGSLWVLILFTPHTIVYTVNLYVPRFLPAG